MTPERAKQIIFQVLQLYRQEATKRHIDQRDFDSWLFSELDIEKQELEEIYRPYSVDVYGAGCFDNGTSPKDYDKTYFDRAMH